MRRMLFILLVLVALSAGALAAGNAGIGPILVTREGEKKMVLFFGDPISVTGPGIWLRAPLVTRVETFDGRLLYLNVDPSSVPTKNQERLNVDNYVVWRIADPQLFYESFGGEMQRAEQRIGDTITADVREEIGRRTIPELLTEARVEIIQTITKNAGEELKGEGIEVVDVRINRTELPDRTIDSVYARMRTEREREARRLRAEGEEQGTRIRAEADRQARVTVAEAKRDAEILRGDGDAQAAAIYAEAYSADPDFYGFVRSLEAYRKTIGEGTTMVLPPEHEFFRELQAPR